MGTMDHTLSHEIKMECKEPEDADACSFVQNLCSAFGWKLLLLIGLAEITLKGFVAGGGSGGLVGLPIEYLMREYSVPAADLQVYKSAVLIPWAIKPLFGLIADSMPILGFNRTPYFAFNSICGVSALFAIALLPSLSLSVLLLMFFLVFMDIAWSDLLCEAVYSTHLREKPEHGPNLISYIWGGIGIGKLVCISMVGVLMENFGNRSPYLIAAPAAAFTLLITFLNLPQETSRRGRCCKKLGGSEMPLAIVGLVIGLGALSLALLSVFGGDLTTKVTCAGILAILALGLVSAALTPIVAKVNAFFFIQSICSFSISGASFYFFTDGPAEYPEGPHLSKEFYTSAIGLVSTVFSLFGMVVYNRWMQHWRYPFILMMGSLLACVCSLISCLVYTRTNVRLGISDKFFVLASDAVQMVVMEIAWLPNMLLMSQLCPKGCEATMFALLAGMGNLGANLGNYFGAYLLHSLGVQPTGSVGDTAQFEHLWLAAVISAIAPIIPLVLVFQLIPNISQKDPIKGLTSSSAGSPLSRFLAKYFDINEISSDDSNQELENIDRSSSSGPRSGSSITGIVPTGTYPCQDGTFMIIGANGDSLFQRLMQAMGRPDLAEDPRFVDNAKRCEHQDLLDEAIVQWTSAKPATEVEAACKSAKVPCGPIFSIKDIMEDEHFQSRGCFEEVPLEGRTLKIPSIGPKLSVTPGRTERGGPRLGQHSEEVLREKLRVGDDELVELKREGVIA